MAKKTKLKNLIITKVALVDEGACDEAHINLFKRRENQNMNLEELLELLIPEQRSIVQGELKKRDDLVAQKDQEIETAKNDLASARKEAEEAKNALTNKKDPETDPNSEEELMKSAPPVLKAMLMKAKKQAEAAELFAKKLQEKEINAKAIAKAKVVKSLPAQETEIVALYKSLNGADSKLATQVFSILEKANALIEKSAAFENKGSDASGTANTADAAWSEIEKAATSIAKSRNMTKEQAIDTVMSEQPILYKNYLDSLRNA